VAYLDTNLLLSYYFENDRNHRHAAEIVESLKQQGKKRYISPLVIVELYAVISRRLEQLRLPPPFINLDREGKIQAVIKDIIQKVEAITTNDECRIDQLNQAKAFHIYVKAIKQAGQLKLKTLDLLHIAYALRLAEKNLADTFATLDREITEKKPILEHLGIKILSNAHENTAEQGNA